MNSIRTHYDNLKVSRDAPPEVIRVAYKALVAKYHPDRNPGSEQSLRTMQAINDSYEVLMNDAKRRDHDRWIADQERLVLERSMAVRGSWEVSNGDPPRREPERPSRFGCGCLGMASFLCIVLFVVFAVAATLTSPHPSSVGRIASPKDALSALGKPAATSSPQVAEPDPLSLPGERVVNVRWNGKHHLVRADMMPTIRKKVDVASWYVSEYLKLKEEKDSLEKRLESSLAGKDQLRQKIADVDARMNELHASGMAVMQEVEAEIKAASP